MGGREGVRGQRENRGSEGVREEGGNVFFQLEQASVVAYCIKIIVLPMCNTI